MRQHLIYLMLAVAIVKLLILILGVDALEMHSDEKNNYQIADNYLKGKNYTDGTGKLTSFHGSFNVWVYQKMIEYNIDKQYYIIFFQCLVLIVFVISLPYFYKILLLFSVPNNIALFSTTIYGFYPSSLYYLGSLFLYENLMTPIMIIVFYVLLNTFKENMTSTLFRLVPFIVTISCLFRPQLLFIYFLIFAVFSFFLLTHWRHQRYNKQKLLILSATALCIIFTHLPILIKNYNLFGSYILSTQVGYELMQGHNDLARGSWYGGWSDAANPYYAYSKKHIKNLDNLNEYEESEARKAFALEWIKNNPLKEAELILRKTAIFFLPRNYEGGFHPINLFVHTAFLISLFLMTFYRKIDFNALSLLLPIAAVYILCQIFFVGYRWRAYIEPFFILFATYGLVKIKLLKMKTA